MVYRLIFREIIYGIFLTNLTNIGAQADNLQSVTLSKQPNPELNLWSNPKWGKLGRLDHEL